MALAIATGVGMSEWERADERTIATAMELLEQAHKKTTRADPQGRQMSG